MRKVSKNSLSTLKPEEKEERLLIELEALKKRVVALERSRDRFYNLLTERGIV